MKTKSCFKCKQRKRIHLFSMDNSTKDRLNIKCKLCIKKYRVTTACDKYKNNAHNRHLKSTYGIGLEDYDSMLVEQDNKCKICNNKGSKGKRFAVDHCHTTKKVRGLLCHKCNVGLGYFQDSAKFLKEAAKYIEES